MKVRLDGSHYNFRNQKASNALEEIHIRRAHYGPTQHSSSGMSMQLVNCSFRTHPLSAGKSSQ